MCGVAGLFQPDGFRDDVAPLIDRMRDALAHRGPDDAASWIDAEAGIAFGHRRLAIVDLSQAGAQPMASSDGRWVTAYNGEIYNHRALRAELGGPAQGGWRGHSDTEVLLEALSRWGVAETLNRLNGMFALALWDRRERRLVLARDPFGEKPLYYGWIGGRLAFASELKALTLIPGFDPAIDPEALAGYVRHAVTPGDRSIYRDIRKLPPGCWMEISSDIRPGEAPAVRRFWDAEAAARAAEVQPFQGARADAARALDARLREAVALRMEADVPLGAMLSGGIDSTLVTALMQAQSDRPVKTFTIGFREAGYDEATHAKAVAAHLGTDHHELYLTADDALAVVPSLAGIYDEPFADSSQIPTLLVARLARRSVTVALSGDGGDELFGGYNRYFHGQSVLRAVEDVPRPLRAAAAALVKSVPPGGWDCLARLAGRGGRIGERAHKLAGVFAASDAADLHRRLLSTWPDEVAVLAHEHRRPPRHGEAGNSFLAAAMLHDTLNYLPNEVLTKVDRASMSVSLEGRIPFLDTRVFDFAWSLPMDMKVRDGSGKHILREVLDAYVPRALMERPKQGFDIPIGAWLRGPLKDWGEHLLDPTRLRDAGVFDVAVVRRTWDEHQSGRRNHDARLWTLLMFEAWRDHAAGKN